MELLTVPTAILAILGLVAAGGAATAWWKRSEGQNTIDLLKTNIASYQITEKQQLTEIETLNATLRERDNTIKELRSTVKTMVKEFKDFKDGS